ncbi:hypothetical protein ACVH9Z_06765 [Rhodococcus opacus]|uniref:hypothetical protein n=1 Tax=Rhodococcus opacus TaxID=37919 RepID=UPI0002FB1D54|nr:hypothetical protein [Rhodococcus opacus]MDI9938705.1 hypothetical protein [Rhodococcus sp. IEGM 1351]MBA8963779.1 hypothetical protein [Rhodococcus opacus]MBP2207270.1 hypothetical protein [Rhodococcus opacus]MDJ0419350.1 hypothetical protein [Rhodococcus opacus]MDV6245810.1 hypothetical protein [Rhodococcus opacus]
MQRRRPYHPILGGAGLVLAGAHSAPERVPPGSMAQLVAGASSSGDTLRPQVIAVT